MPEQHDHLRAGDRTRKFQAAEKIVIDDVARDTRVERIADAGVVGEDLHRLRVNKTATLKTGGELAMAFRKNSPRLAAEIDAFIAAHRLGTSFGNIIMRRYLQNTSFATRATMGEERQQFLLLEDLFRKYGDKYKLDYLLMMAKGYQESRLDRRARSSVGAIGIMQIMPATGKT